MSSHPRFEMSVDIGMMGPKPAGIRKKIILRDGFKVTECVFNSHWIVGAPGWIAYVTENTYHTGRC